MAKDSRNGSNGEGREGHDETSLDTLIRQRARGLIDAIVEEELAAALGAALSERIGGTRQGYRHGTRGRTLTTKSGADDLCDAAGPRADGGGCDDGMAQRAGAPLSTPQRPGGCRHSGRLFERDEYPPHQGRAGAAAAIVDIVSAFRKLSTKPEQLHSPRGPIAWSSAVK